MKRERKWFGKAVAWLILLGSVGLMLLSGFRLRETSQINQIGEESYQSLADLVRPAGLPVFPNAQTAARTETSTGDGAVSVPDLQPNVDIPNMSINFEALRMINPNAVAWLYGPDTVIDYPVVRASEYDYYLHHLPDGTYNANGTLFIDYNWNSFDDRYTIVYGHNMKSGRMFGSLTNYKGQQYYNDNPYLYLYTADSGNFRIDLLYGCVIGAGQWRERAFMFNINLDTLLSYAANNTTFKSSTQYTPGDRIIALSTCSYEFDDARYVVIGKLVPVY